MNSKTAAAKSPSTPATPERTTCSFVVPTQDGAIRCVAPFPVTPDEAVALAKFVTAVARKRDRMIGWE